MSRITLAILATLAVAAPASAQVGHPPGDSPFRDIPKGHQLTVFGGYFGGGGGTAEVGPRGGPVFGARYDIRVNSPLQLGLAVSHATLDRYIADPFVTIDERYSGPVEQSVTSFEVGLQFNVTGGKSWHRLAPFAGLAAGIARGSGTAADTSGYEFGTKFLFAPQIGTRVFLSRRLHLRIEGRATFWNLGYPETFLMEPPSDPDPEVPNGVLTDNRDSEWVVSPSLVFGLGYQIKF